MSWTIADERRVLAGLPPAQVRAVRRVRRRAAELISQRGWVQGEEFGSDGYCISGALYAAAWELERAGALAETGIAGSGIAEFTKRVICMELCLAWRPEGACPLRAWNDQAGRRLDEVLAALAGPVEIGGLPTLLWVLPATTGGRHAAGEEPT